MSNQIDLEKYQKFVAAVTSRESMNFDDLLRRINELRNSTNVNISLLMTASIGLASEGGEFSEIVKKILFQGKPLTDAEIFHMKRELGDIIWYWTDACTALGLNPNDVIQENVNKLESRYPGGTFDAHYSENRKEGDL
jgi:NTP pyrophosphatase (non-canonical NTP hydrolase)